MLNDCVARGSEEVIHKIWHRQEFSPGLYVFCKTRA